MACPLVCVFGRVALVCVGGGSLVHTACACPTEAGRVCVADSFPHAHY